MVGTTGPNYGSFDLPEIMIFTDRLTATQRSGLRSYFSGRYDSALNGPGYGEIYVANGTTTQFTNAVAGTFDFIFGFNNPQGVTGEHSAFAVADKTLSQVRIDEAGTYHVQFACSFAGNGTTVLTCAIHLDGVIVPGAAFQRKVTSNDTGSATCQTLITATAGQIVRAYVASDGTNDDFLPEFMNLNVKRID